MRITAWLNRTQGGNWSKRRPGHWTCTDGRFMLLVAEQAGHAPIYFIYGAGVPQMVQPGTEVSRA